MFTFACLMSSLRCSISKCLKGFFLIQVINRFLGEFRCSFLIASPFVLVYCTLCLFLLLLLWFLVSFYLFIFYFGALVTLHYFLYERRHIYKISKIINHCDRVGNEFF